MSDKERPTEVGGNGGGGGNGGSDDEDSDGPTEMGDPKDKKWKGCWRKGKRLSLLFRLRKGKKQLQQKKKQKGIYVNSGCWWSKVSRGGAGGGGYCCLKRPRTVDSSGESPTSDPNSPEFTFDMLRTLIEKNDFYSKECNPHLDTDD